MKCAGWFDLGMNLRPCKRTLTKRNTNEESLQIGMCKYCLNAQCRHIEKCSN